PAYTPSVFVSALFWDGGVTQSASLAGNINSGADLTAHIGSLQYDRRNALRVRYRVLPEQTSWTTTRELDVPLGRRRWGTHTLEVQAQLGAGPWSGTVSHSFNVLKPFWLTWPALAGFSAFSLAGGSLGRVWWRRRRRLARALPELAEWRLAALVPEAYDLLGATLDQRFTVVSVLGRGGFATVFAGDDLRQQCRCAIKVFRGEVAEDAWLGHRIHQEIAALEAVQHENVVRTYGHGLTPAGAPYLVMEFIEGETLRDLIARGPLPPPHVARLLRQCGSALQALHRRGIYHRDLKPENIMLRAGKSGDRELVLIDFSIAIVKEPDRTLHGLSRAAGTVHYMAPEQVVGHAGPVSDIYSLAKIVIEMLTGKRVNQLLPEASLDLPGQVRELLGGLRLGLSPASIDLLCSGLQFDPARRPGNAAEFADVIAGAVMETVNS
ncbi:MAG TPA: serine/threonine-protein kinase, partial [Terriglobales bacterium]|nr:serine/threonine-protein kinase [Terriglobales bacterium]